MRKAIGTSDEKLLEEFCAGSARAFGLIVEKHLPMVRAVAGRVLGDRHEAEDVTQAVFILLARKARSLRKPGALSSWLFRAAEFTARRSRRKLKIRAECERKAAVASQKKEPAGREVPPEWPEVRGRLDRAIAGLSGNSRRAVVLCYLEGRSREEVASTLGCSTDALAMRLSRAVKRLREKLGAEGVYVSVGGLTAGLVFECAWSCARAATGSPAAVAAAATAAARGEIFSGAAGAVQLASEVSRALVFGKVLKGAAGAVGAGMLLVLAGAIFRGDTQSSAGVAGDVIGRQLIRSAYRGPGDYSAWVSQWRFCPAGTEAGNYAWSAGIARAVPEGGPAQLGLHPSPSGRQLLMVSSGADTLSFRYVANPVAGFNADDAGGPPRKLRSDIVRAGVFPVSWLPGGRFLLSGSSRNGEMLLELFGSNGRRLRSIPVPEVPTEVLLVGARRLRSIAPVLVDPLGNRVAVLRTDYAGKGRLDWDLAVVLPLRSGTGARRVLELGRNANVVEVVWEQAGSHLLVARAGRSGRRMSICIDRIDVTNGNAARVLSKLLFAPAELRGLDWPRGVPRVSFSPDLRRVLIVWRDYGSGARVLRAGIAEVANGVLAQLPWVDGPGGNSRKPGGSLPPVYEPRWSADARRLTYAVARPGPGISASLYSYDVSKRKAQQLASWQERRGPRAADVFALQGGSIAFLANDHLWIQGGRAEDTPVPLAVVPVGMDIRPVVAADGGSVYWADWQRDAGGKLSCRGIRVFTARMPANNGKAAAYWRVFRSGRSRAELESDLRELVASLHTGPVARLAAEYLREHCRSEPRLDVGMGRNARGDGSAEVF